MNIAKRGYLPDDINKYADGVLLQLKPYHPVVQDIHKMIITEDVNELYNIANSKVGMMCNIATEIFGDDRKVSEQYEAESYEL